MNHELNLNIASPEQVLVNRDSLYYGTRFLKKQAEEFIIEEAGKIRGKGEIKINIRAGNISTPEAEEIKASIHRHFAYRKKKADREIREWISRGWKSLLIALVFLGIIFLLLELARDIFTESGLPMTLREFLIILGWVALWKPADLLLYEWRPYKRESRLYERLANAKIEMIN